MPRVYTRMTDEERRAAANASSRRWRASLDPERRTELYRKQNLKAKYGLDQESYEQLLEAQTGTCAICGDTPERSLRVDHEHDSGSVRGLLCHHCNIGLGHFKDNIEVLEAAIAYLKRSKKEL